MIQATTADVQSIDEVANVCVDINTAKTSKTDQNNAHVQLVIADGQDGTDGADTNDTDYNTQGLLKYPEWPRCL